MYTHVYVYTYIHIHICRYIHMYRAARVRDIYCVKLFTVD